MRKLALFSGGFAAAAAIFVYLLRDVRALWLAGACLAFSPLALRLGLRRCCAAALGLAAGLLWCAGYQQLWLAPADRLCDTTQQVALTLTEDPTATDYGSRAMGTIQADDRRYSAVLYADEALMKATAGDCVTVQAKIRRAGLSIADGESLYLRAQGVVLQLQSEDILSVEPGRGSWPVRLRQYLQNRLHVLYSGEAAGLLRALLTGDRSELSYGIQNELSVAGLSHAVAVSGMHVSMLLAMVSLLCGHNPRLTALFGIPVVVAFTLMTGASPSACRAAVMQTMLLLAPLVRREQDGLTALSAAALVLLLQNPWAVASVSFQLSFAAVLGLFVLAEPLQRRLLGRSKKAGRIRRYLAGSAAASVAATVVTLPLTVYYFGLISLAAVLTNLLALWAVTAVFTLGAISCFAGALGPVLAWPVSKLSAYLLGLCRLIARFPYAAAYPQNLPLMCWAVAAYGVLCWLLLRGSRKMLPLLSVLTAGLLLCVLWGRAELTRGTPVCRVLDVGQGQCIYWQTGGFSALIDCGGENPEEAGELAARTLLSGGQTHVDLVVLTHYDADHAGGVEQLLRRVRVGLLLLPETAEESDMQQNILAAASASACQVCMVTELTEVEFSGGKLTVYPPVSQESGNNSGISVLATGGEYDMLVTGDLDRFAEMRLLSRWAIPHVELLVAGHHGSKTSTSEALLEAVQPQTVVISVGADNSYGHPAQETLDRIAQTGAAVYRTDRDGTVILRN